MQIAGEGGKAIPKEYRNVFTAASHVVKKDGFKSLFAGLSAGLTRQLTYTTLRIGLYNTMMKNMSEEVRKSAGGKSALVRAGCGLSAGAIASFICCPVDVCLVRMQADIQMVQKRGYKHIGDALCRIAKEEGWKTFWRGATPTVLRAMVVNTTQIATYDQVKQMYLQYTNWFKNEKSVYLHFASSLTAGLFYSFASLPLDIAKTRMQKQKPLADGRLLYRNTLQTLVQIAKKEGVLKLWKGFTPYFMRSGTHTICMLMFLEQFRRVATYFGVYKSK